MSSKREKPSEAVTMLLHQEANGICPLCTGQLIYKKDKKYQRLFEIAHIYPLNPTETEKALLSSAEKLSSDTNDKDNLIALCPNCHTKFDKPRTLEDYNNLLRIKKNHINNRRQKELWQEFNIDKELVYIISNLENLSCETPYEHLDLNPKTIDEKIHTSESNLFTNKVKHHVNEYYSLISNQFRLLDDANPGKSERIALEVKTFYTAQKHSKDSQHSIYRNISDWVDVKTGQISRDASEILVSFFIQNCEIFS